MEKISFKEFDQIYQRVVQDILGFWSPELQAQIAEHNIGWHPANYDFRNYCQASAIRFYHAYTILRDYNINGPICDLGGFLGIWALTLRQLGYNVTMTETLSYYPKSFDALYQKLRDNGVQIIDYDPFEPGRRLPMTYPFISAFAVIEHYPHSLEPFMSNVLRILAPGGKFYIESPNIACLEKRINLLFGKSPLCQLPAIYKSKIPFTGHHHEMTIFELRSLGELANLKRVREVAYNYSPSKVLNLSFALRHPLSALCYKLRPNTREVLAVLFEKNGQEGAPHLSST